MPSALERREVREQLRNVQRGYRRALIQSERMGLNPVHPDESPSFFHQLESAINRPQQAVFKLIEGIQRGDDPETTMHGVWMALQGNVERQRFADILRRSGMQDGRALAIMGLTGDILADPINFVPLGGLSKISKAARVKLLSTPKGREAMTWLTEGVLRTRPIGGIRRRFRQYFVPNAFTDPASARGFEESVFKRLADLEGKGQVRRVGGDVDVFDLPKLAPEGSLIGDIAPGELLETGKLPVLSRKTGRPVKPLELPAPAYDVLTKKPITPGFSTEVKIGKKGVEKIGRTSRVQVTATSPQYLKEADDLQEMLDLLNKMHNSHIDGKLPHWILADYIDLARRSAKAAQRMVLSGQFRRARDFYQTYVKKLSSGDQRRVSHVAELLGIADDAYRNERIKVTLGSADNADDVMKAAEQMREQMERIQRLERDYGIKTPELGGIFAKQREAIVAKADGLLKKNKTHAFAQAAKVFRRVDWGSDMANREASVLADALEGIPKGNWTSGEVRDLFLQSSHFRGGIQDLRLSGDPLVARKGVPALTPAQKELGETVLAKQPPRGRAYPPTRGMTELFTAEHEAIRVLSGPKGENVDEGLKRLGILFGESPEDLRPTYTALFDANEGAVKRIPTLRGKPRILRRDDPLEISDAHPIFDPLDLDQAEGGTLLRADFRGGAPLPEDVIAALRHGLEKIVVLSPTKRTEIEVFFMRTQAQNAIGVFRDAYKKRVTEALKGGKTPKLALSESERGRAIMRAIEDTNEAFTVRRMDEEAARLTIKGLEVTTTHPTRRLRAAIGRGVKGGPRRSARPPSTVTRPAATAWDSLHDDIIVDAVNKGEKRILEARNNALKRVAELHDRVPGYILHYMPTHVAHQLGVALKRDPRKARRLLGSVTHRSMIERTWLDKNKIPLTFEEVDALLSKSQEELDKIGREFLRKPRTWWEYFRNKPGKMEDYFGLDAAGTIAIRSQETAKVIGKKEFRDSIQKLFGNYKLPDGQSLVGWEGATFMPEVARELRRWEELYFGQASIQSFLRWFDNAQGIWKAYTLFPFPAYHTRNVIGDLWNMSLGGFFTRDTVGADGILEPFHRAMPDWGWVTDMGRAMKMQKAVTTKNLDELSSIKIIAKNGESWSGDEFLQLLHARGALDIGYFADNYDAAAEATLKLSGGLFRDGKMNVREIKEAITDQGIKVWRQLYTPAEMPKNLLIRSGKATAEAINNTHRVAFIMKRLRMGDNLDEAIQHVQKYLFDYLDLTPFETQVARRVFPFYTWTRKNLPLQIQGLLNSPQKFTRIDKVVRDIQAGQDGLLGPWFETAEAKFSELTGQEKHEYEAVKESDITPIDIPMWMRRAAGVPLRRRKDTGEIEFFTRLAWIPAAELERLGAPSFGRNFTEMLSPIPKVILETGTRRNFFFDQDLDGTTEFLGQEMDARIANVLNNIRILSEIDRLNLMSSTNFSTHKLRPETEETTPQKLLRIATGVKLYPTDIRRARLYNMMPALDETRRKIARERRARGRKAERDIREGKVSRASVLSR